MIAPRFRHTLGSIATFGLVSACGGSPGASVSQGQMQADDPVATADPASASPADTALAPAPVTAASPTVLPTPGSGDPSGIIDDPNAQSDIPPVELSDKNACAGLELVPEEVEVDVPMDVTTTTEVVQPVAFYIVLDNSLSMNNALPDGATGSSTRWDLAVQSIRDFVSSPASDGLDVAIQYFNPPGQGGQLVDDGPLCDGTAHASPDVVMGSLPDNQQALVDSLTAARPTGYTPTVGALTGGIQYCAAYEAQNPDEQCVVLLVTDGVPWSCGLGDQADVYDPASTDMLVPIAAAGLAENVETYTVAMDGVPEEGFAMLDAIAVAGGTDCTPAEDGHESCNVSSTGSQGLVETLNAIRDTVTVTETVTEVTTVIEKQKLDCQWLIPDPPDQETLDPTRVNVTLAVSGGEPEFIGSVASEADCAATGGVGWYYDNPTAPTTIYACPTSCSQIQDGVDPVVNVLLGCETIQGQAR